ncbi:U3 snoRNP protein Utp20 [Schizosaccharomyces japonicus yFS275]|uniref:U3 snoRNP protein Utp20 n=1 Tax=Schizosaccharomyces japonicus (strain yFS275 / FY16936) TaxID=402676 RepID=B6JVH5_SCHJY|nr:U3 snoRNP protein Utp20 [Schizosaccharomyces japonicus yFS275]EEB05376.2 U3 snoRNP protein Utp20 [Schizosaccharomyces japonicus yFS275]
MSQQRLETRKRNHVFLPFSKRVESLKIDVAHKIKRPDEIADESISSFTLACLRRWEDLNLSTNFVEFSRALTPLVQSLPQILFHQKDIFEVIKEYALKGNALSVQPILEILTQFARDLSADFEPYIYETLSLLSSLAQSTEIDVIDWVFQTEAYMFKYMRKIMVPQITEVYDKLSPLFGKEHEKHYIIRFSAEALAFLARLCSETERSTFVSHVIKDLSSNYTPQFFDGVVTLFVQIIKGVGTSIHSKGVHYFKHLLDPEVYCMPHAADVCDAVLVALIRHSNRDSFTLLQDIISGCMQKKPSMYASLFFLLEEIQHAALDTEHAKIVYEIAASLILNPQISDVLPHCKKLLQKLQTLNPLLYLAFANYLRLQNHERYQSFVRSTIPNVLSQNFTKLNKAVAAFVLYNPFDVSLDFTYINSAVERLRNPEKSYPLTDETDNYEALYSSIWSDLQIFHCSNMPKPEKVDLVMRLLDFFSGSSKVCHDFVAFLYEIVSIDLVNELTEDQLQTMIAFGVTHLDRMSDSYYFLESFNSLLMCRKVSLGITLEQASETLLPNLLKGGVNLRVASLKLLATIFKTLNSNVSPFESMKLCLQFAELPQDLSSVRDAALQLRNLATRFGQVSNEHIKYAIIYFLTGSMLTKFTPLWKHLSSTLSQILPQKPNEKYGQVLLSWLSQNQPPQSNLSDVELNILNELDEDRSVRVLTELPNCNCLVLNKNRQVFHDVFLNFKDSARFLYKNFLKKVFQDFSNLPSYRSQALRVMLDSPHVIRPLLEKLDEYLFDIRFEYDINTNWLRQDVYLILEVYTKFKDQSSSKNANNRRDFFSWLLTTNDAKVQKLSLQNILSWNEEALVTYSENLERLLDDKTFRDELTTFLFVDEDASIIQDKHRSLLMPVVISILFGKMTARGYGGQKNQSARRATVLATIGNLRTDDLGSLIQLMLRPYTHLQLNLHSVSDLTTALGKAPVSARRQIGFLTMLIGISSQLSSKLEPFAEQLADASLYSLAFAENHLQTEPADSYEAKNLHTVKHHASEAIFNLMQKCTNTNWDSRIVLFYTYFVEPRLNVFAAENAQAVSRLLRLITLWTESFKYLSVFIKFGHKLIPVLLNVVTNPSVKPSVVLHVMNTYGNILLFLEGENEEMEDEAHVAVKADIRSKIIEPTVVPLFERITHILEQPIFSDDSSVLTTVIQLLFRISPFVSTAVESTKLLDLIVPFLRKPKNIASNAAKDGILGVVSKFIPNNSAWVENSYSTNGHFNLLMSLFSLLSSVQSRSTLQDILSTYSNKFPELNIAYVYVKETNAMSTRRLDEPDFGRRLSAYNSFNETQYLDVRALSWLPIVYNALYYVQDEEELAIRTSASMSLKRFIDGTAKHGFKDEVAFITKQYMLPRLAAGLKVKSELIRQEYVSILDHMIKFLPDFTDISDMKVLQFAGDEEANFFNNILHIQVHRRQRAIKRLSTTALQGNLKSNNIARIFIPLLEHFCFGEGTAKVNQSIIDESILAIGDLAKGLVWTQYFALLKRYMKLLKDSNVDQKIAVRMLSIVISAIRTKEEAIASYTSEESEQNEAEVKPANSCQLRSSLPAIDKFVSVVATDILPSLLLYLHIREESTVSLRVPIALSIVQLLSVMPKDEVVLRLPPVLTDICHILRSRSQDSRDETRKVLSAIALYLGPSYFSFILKELKGSLQRGYQLHVLGYTVHSLLLSVEPYFPYGSLDYCLPMLADIFVNEIFGEVGLEKDAEDYRSNVKEIKGNKSYDSYEAITRLVSFPVLPVLIKPLKNILGETTLPKSLRKVDEVLRRISLGLMDNKNSNSRESLVFCFNIFDYVKQECDTISKRAQIDDRFRRNHFPQNSSKLIRFAIDSLRGIVSRNRELMTEGNLSPFIPLVGDALLGSSEDAFIASLRFLTLVLPLNMQSVRNGSKVFISQAVKFVRESSATNTELCQASLKFLANIILDPEVEIKESVLSYLLERIAVDIEEPDRQGVMFSLIRSSLSRKVKTPEMYKIMDKIRDMMVTNQTKTTRQVARNLYFTFLLDFPQGKIRLTKQFSFILKNLEYKYPPGRESVMELLHSILNGFSDSVLLEFLHSIFMALVMVLVNDDDAHCREMAAILIKSVFTRADTERFSQISDCIKQWAITHKGEQSHQLQSMSLQLLGLVFETFGFEKDDLVTFFLQKLNEVSENAAADLNNTEEHWETVYFCLQAWMKLVVKDADEACSEQYLAIWKHVRSFLLYKHAWVRLSVSRLYGHLFARCSEGSLAKVPLLVADLQLDLQTVVQISNAFQLQLRSSMLTEELGVQTTKNLVFIMRYLANIVEEHQEPLEEMFAHMAKSLKHEKIEAATINKRFMTQWFVIAVHALDKSVLLKLLKPIVSVFYRYTELNEAEIKAQQDLVDMTSEAMSVLQNKVGTTAYANAYNAVRQEALETRRARKEKRAIELVADPEAASRKKLKHNFKKKESRKRKAAHQKALNAIYKRH